MSDVISKLSVQLALESGSFAKQMSAINKEVKNLDRDFKSAGKGVEGFEKTFVDLDAKITKTSKQLDLYSTKLDKQKEAYTKLENTVEKQITKLNELEQANRKGSDEWNRTAELVQKNSEKLNRLGSDINSTESNISKLTTELNQAQQEFQQLGQKTETLDDKLDKISQSANLAESEFNRLASELAQSGGYFAKLGNEMDKLSSQVDSGKSKINAYEQEISKIGSVLDKAKSEHNELGQAINKCEQELDQAKSSYGENSSEVVQLKAKLLQLKDSYNQVETEIEQNENALNGYQTELNNTVADVNRLSNELRTMPFDRVGNDMKSVGQSVKGMGYDLMPLTAGIVGAGTAGVKMSIDFEKSFAKVSTLLDEGSVDFGKYKDGIVDSSREMGVSVGEFSEAVYQSISAGVDQADAIKFTSDAVKLAKGGFTETATAVDLMTTIMNSYGEKAGSVEQIMDSLINTQNTGKTTVDELASSMGKIIPIANGAGVGFNDLNGAMATLTAGGISTAESTTYLKSMINELAKSGTKVSDILKDKTGKSFQELMESGVPLGDTLRTLKKHADDNGLAFNDLFGSSEAATAAMALMEDGGVTLDQKIKDIVDTTGSANEAFGKMEDTTGSKLFKSFNNLKTSIMEMGDVLAPVVESLSEGISKVADWFSSLDENAQKNVVTFGIVVAAIAPLMIILGNLIVVGGNIVTIFGGISAATGGAGGAIAALSSVAIPVLLGALALVAVAIGDSSNMLLMLQEKFGGLGTVIGGVCEFMSGIWDLTFKSLISVAELGMDVIAAMIDGPGGATVKDAWQRYNDRTVALHEEAADKLTLTTTRGLSQMRHATDEQLNGCITTMDSILSQVPAIVDGNYKQAASTVATQLSTMDSTQISTLQAMNDTTRMMFQGIKEGMNVDEATTQVMNNLKLMQANGKLNTETLEKDVSSAMETMKKNMDNKTKEGSKAVDKNTKEAKDKASKNTKELAKDVDKNTKDAKSNADKNTKDAANSVKNNTDKMAKDAKTNTSKVATDTDIDFKKANKSIQQESTNMYNGAKQSFTKLAEIAKQAGSDMYNGVSKSAQKMTSSAKTSASDMYRGVTTSTRQMANQAISDWNRVRSAYSSPIRASISVVKTQPNRTINEKAIQAANVLKNINTPASMSLRATSNGLNSNGISILGASSPISAFKSSTTGFTLTEDTQKNLEEQLKTTKSVEEKITEILRKEIEKRKKLIDSESKNRIDQLNKQKDTYNDSRKQIDYENDYNDQLNKIKGLQKQYDNLSGDNSLGTKKKLDSILKQIEIEQKRLEDLVRSKIDSDINSSFDDEIHRIESEANKAKNELDNLLEPDALRDFINQTLESGVFEHINGEVSSLKDAMLEFVDEYGDGISSIGALIKSELIENLNVAMETMKDMTNVLGQLGVVQYRVNTRSLSLAGIDYYSDRYRNKQASKNKDSNNKSNGGISININAPMINIEGNADESLVNDLNSLENRLVKKIAQEIMSKVDGR
ncbi:MAG: phage tail tape measure protein [Paraclostridium bifermentans]|uniref:phage tail tape measure protein n=1 Tax=Paraclostridium bifermentans TaxID=1490 RepID=UPI001DF8B8A5|nr:phage tail tape measure protein [Paraclostridium bifermentans]MBS6509787.1 phage tail tape measure protein [Paraclostridium bifermentans]